MEHHWNIIITSRSRIQWICINCGVKRYTRETGEYFYSTPQIPGYYGINQEPICGKILTNEDRDVLMKDEYSSKIDDPLIRIVRRIFTYHDWQQSDHTSWQNKCQNCKTVRWRKQGQFVYYNRHISAFPENEEPECILYTKIYPKIYNVEFKLDPKHEMELLELFKKINGFKQFVPFYIILDKILGDLKQKRIEERGYMRQKDLLKADIVEYKSGDILSFTTTNGCKVQCRIFQLESI